MYSYLSPLYSRLQPRAGGVWGTPDALLQPGSAVYQPGGAGGGAALGGGAGHGRGHTAGAQPPAGPGHR